MALATRFVKTPDKVTGPGPRTGSAWASRRVPGPRGLGPRLLYFMLVIVIVVMTLLGEGR